MMLPRTPKHDFLDRLHGLVEPDRYLEIGVQTGTSLDLARDYTNALGIDPEPRLDERVRRRPNTVVYPVTSDHFFANVSTDQLAAPVDLAYIDGMHLIEYVLRDLANVEEWMRPGGVIAIDDVLPYDDAIAHRTPLAGDWAGDVWKLWPILAKWRPDLTITMVDVAPTGLMVLQDLQPTLGPATLRGFHDAITATWAVEVPGSRNWLHLGALDADEAFATISALYNQLNEG